MEGFASFHRNIIFIFFFFSGASGLVFEVIWSRMLSRVFGSTTFALSALLTAFMTGLALGSELLGRRARTIRRPLSLYGALEIGIGLYALLVPTLLGWVAALYGPLFQELHGDFYLFSLARFALVFVVLVVPTILMGATLPLLSEHTARWGSGWEGRAGLLYGVNTIGACAGTVMSGFWLLATYGQTTTNMTFAALSCALGLSVITYDALTHDDAAPERAEGPTEEGQPEINLFADEPEHNVQGWMIPLMLGSLGVAGAVSMTYQVLWTRAYVMILGSSTYSFSLILSMFLIGLGGGSALMSAGLRFVRRPVLWLAMAQLGVCVFGAVCFFTLNKVPEWLFWHLRSSGRTPMSVFFYNVFLIGVVVLIPTLLQGVTFPLLIRVLSSWARRRDAAEGGVGQLVGRAYAINTVGAIVGSFASGFVLLPLMGLRYAMGLAIGASLVVGLGFGAMSLRLRFEPSKAAALGVMLAAAVALAVSAPELNLTRLSSGAFRVYWSRELFTPESFQRSAESEPLFYSDGVAATISVERHAGLLTLKANGKPEASNGEDMATQILVGLLPLVMHEATPHARALQREGRYEGAPDVAMVGFGSGVTAGGSLTYPLGRLDVVEIEPAMLEASRFFDEVNHRPLEDPRIRVIESDGRNFLEYTADHYDVIISEPSNPWIAGVASLFTVEHFERARRRLKPGGLFCQWVQLYELRPENVGRIFKTFRQAFPHVMIFSSMEKGTDLIMIGSDEPLTLPVDGYPRAWGSGQVRRELRRAGVETIDDLYGLLFLGDGRVTPFVKGLEAELGHEIVVNTDDNGILGYEAPKDLIRYDQADRFFASIYYGDAIYGDPRPFLEGLDDPQGPWDGARLERLAYASFIKGKQRLAGELAAMALERGGGDLARKVEASWRLYDEGLQGRALRDWPNVRSQAYRALEAANRESSALPALELLYATEARDEDIFTDPEVTLAAAVLMFEIKHFKRAHAQVTWLLEHEPEFVARTPLVHLVVGFTATRRRRYAMALRHFVRYLDANYPQPPSLEAPER